jgi:glucose-1-phosphate thymidylyltransferase
VNNAYVNKNQMTFSLLKGFWSDAGTFDSLIRASVIVQQYRKNQGKR